MIRDMNQSDIGIVHKLGSEIKEFEVSEGGERFWPKSVLEDWVNSGNDISLIAEQDGTVVGFLLAAYHMVSKKATVENLFVSPGYRRQSIADKLYIAAEERLRKIGADFICSYVEIDNIPIIGFLEKRGFVAGKDYYLMTKFL